MTLEHSNTAVDKVSVPRIRQYLIKSVNTIYYKRLLLPRHSKLFSNRNPSLHSQRKEGASLMHVWLQLSTFSSHSSISEYATTVKAKLEPYQKNSLPTHLPPSSSLPTGQSVQFAPVPGARMSVQFVPIGQPGSVHPFWSTSQKTPVQPKEGFHKATARLKLD